MPSGRARRRIVVLVAASAMLVAAWVPPRQAVAAAEASESGAVPPQEAAALADLLATLALIPADAETLNGIRLAAYVDYRAAEQAGGLAGAITRTSFLSMDNDGFDRWSIAVSRLELAAIDTAHELGRERTARRLPDVGSIFRALPGILGFDWFAIDQSAASGDLQDGLVILRGADLAAGSGDVEATLSAHGFQQKDLSGLPVWHRFSDGEIREDAALPNDILGDRSKDPFGVSDGHAARIALLGDAALGASSWNRIETAIEYRAAGRTLADIPTVRAAAEALADPGTAGQTLIQAIFVRHPYLTAREVARARLGQFATDQQVETLAKEWEARPALPPYALVAVADAQLGDDEIAIVALAYDDSITATKAAKVLVSRFEAFRSPLGQPRLIDAYRAVVTARVHEAADRKAAVALVAFRSKPRIEAAISDERPGRMFKALLERFRAADVDPLIVEPE